MKRYRAVILILVVTIVVFLYMYLNPPFTQDPIFNLPFEGDIPSYLSRFILSFLLMAVLPVSFALLLGFSLRDMGLVWHRGMLKWKWFWILLLATLIAVFLSAFNNYDMIEFYPYSKTIVHKSINGSPGLFVLHVFMYFVLFYIPWEILFRGIMILPLVHYYESRQAGNAGMNENAGSRFQFQFLYPAINKQQTDSWNDPVLLALAVLQTLPATLVHLPHPPVESLGTIVFNFIAAIMVLRTRSIFPILIIHASAGILLDTLILFGSRA